MRQVFHLHYGDMTDGMSLLRIINLVGPDEVYNLAARAMLLYHLEPNYIKCRFAWLLKGVEAIKSSNIKHRCGSIKHQHLSYMETH